MTKRNIMSALNVTPDGKHSKKPYDLRNFEDFHTKGGMINVIGVRDTVPNSNYRMSVDNFTRTLLCNTANFARMKENFYFVHVPLGLISRNAYQMLVQRPQSYSAAPMDIQQFPVFNLAAVVKRCIEIGSKSGDAEAALDDEWFDVHGNNICPNALRLLDNLGYGYYGDILRAVINEDYTLNEAKGLIDAALSGVKPSVARIGAYQCVWYNFFRNDIYDTDVDASCYNFDDCTLVLGSSAVEYDVTEVRTVDSFIQNCLQMRYNPYKKDLFMSSMPGTQFGAVSTVSLMDNVVFDISGSSVQTAENAPTTSSYQAVMDASAQNNLGSLRVLPPDSSSGEYGRVVSAFAPNAATAVSYQITHKHSVSLPDADGIIAGGTSLFDVLSLVESQAIQKWRQKSMLAGNKTVDQFRAHHGVVPRHLIDHLPDFIGSVDNEIVVKEITSQANTLDASEGQNNLGEIRGRGYGISNARTFDFYSDDYGILLLLHAIVPENTYSSFGLDKGNMMVYYSDFFQQEYENIGLESVPKILLNSLARYPFPEVAHGTGQTDGSFADDLDEGNCGYAPRNYGYKQYLSKVHGMFNPNRLGGLNASEPNIFGYADMQSFVLPRTDMVGLAVVHQASQSSPTTYVLPSLTMSLSKLYVNPKVFNSIFAIDADKLEDTDTFILHRCFNCDSLLPMTVTGLPQF